VQTIPTPTYLRVSLLSACNLRCLYCLPSGRRRRAKIAPPEQVRSATRFLYDAGVRKIRFTGGEPTMYKGLTELVSGAIEHDGFSFLNVMSPCVTWRGDDEFKRLKEMLQKLPEDHDPSKRGNAIDYTRETDVLTTGVLYEVEAPTMIDRVEAIKREAMDDKPAPSTQEILSTFYPSF